MKKIITGTIISTIIVAAVSFGNLEFMLSPKIIILYVMGIIASYYQPEYHPLKGKNNDVDQGTVLQILWSVYLTQFLALLEARFINFPSSLEWSPLTYIFLAVSFFGLWFRSWAYLTLGKFFTMHIETQSGHRVIDHGPYLFVRHPSYTGAYLTYVFNPLFLGSHYSAVLSVVILGWAFYRRIEVEEKMLLRDLGSEYEKFSATRKKLLPMIW